MIKPMSQLRSLLRLKKYLRPHLWLITGSALLAIPLSALRVSPAAIVKYVIDDLLEKKNAHALYIFPLIVIAIYVANFIVRFGHYYLLRIVVARVNQRVKNDLFEHLLGLSANYFTTQSTGTLISRVGVDPQFIDGGLIAINILIREPITFLLLFGYALKLNWRLTVITLIIFPPLVWVFARTGKHLKRYIGRMTEENARVYSSLQEGFSGFRMIKTFQLEKYVRKKFREKNERFTSFHLKTALLEEVSHPTVELITAFAIAGVIYYGGTQVIHNQITGGDLMGFFAAFALMMNPLRSLNDVNIRLHQAAAACERIFEIFDWQSSISEISSPIHLKGVKEGIEVKNVSFAYPDAPERMVLKNITFGIPRGKAIALVGASGAGKSSLVSLLPRIFDVTAGKIEVDGQDIRSIALDDLRRMIAVVSQDVFLFNDTIEENIRCGRFSATKTDIREAAKRAYALDFIESLPDGFQTQIGDRGQKLSGGERQRVSIARAFLREAPILILDEATSSLDSTSERAVQVAIDELMMNRTTLIIAHRLSTIRHADRIVVIRDGEIVEQGNHEELMTLGKEYARFMTFHK